jgi:hypothetical protein
MLLAQELKRWPDGRVPSNVASTWSGGLGYRRP